MLQRITVGKMQRSFQKLKTVSLVQKTSLPLLQVGSKPMVYFVLLSPCGITVRWALAEAPVFPQISDYFWLCFWRNWPETLDEFGKYRSAPLSAGDMFKDPQWMTETTGCYVPYIYYAVFSYAYIYLSLKWSTWGSISAPALWDHY